ncbi:hypothetical protein NDU88_008234 [Pleurodeles waltl]|uniref:Uncharacterized protein n=1 Tax=Pleurodeles waltl TaxID=8319 RepID=A0AAV7N4C6_PLEWA|nr:hypothetical protein NDU88_008234 [Pleurodeles waltl]
MEPHRYSSWEMCGGTGDVSPLRSCTLNSPRQTRRHLRHALRRHIKEGESLRVVSPLEDRLLLEPLPGFNNTPDPLRTLREAWEGDCGSTQSLGLDGKYPGSTSRQADSEKEEAG